MHLLWCESCQSRVDEEAEFALATRSAVLVLERQEARPLSRMRAGQPGFRRMIGSVQALFSTRMSVRWAGCGLSVGMLLAMAGLLPLHREDRWCRRPCFRVSAAVLGPRCRGERGERQSALRIEASDVSPASSFQVAVVNSEGRPIETRTADAVAGNVNVALHKKLTPGQYWVRLSTRKGTCCASTHCECALAA